MEKEIKKVSKKDSRIRELQTENKRLRAEVQNLKHELDTVKNKRIFHDSGDKSLVNFEKRSANIRLFSKRSYTAYLAALISNTSIFKLYKRFISIAKKYTLITVSLQIAAYILTLIQSSAIFVVAASLFIVSLPFTFIFGYSAVILTFFGRKRVYKKLTSTIREKDIAVFFAPKTKKRLDDSFFSGMVREWTERNGGVAIIVSPYFLSRKGVSTSKKYYFVMRQETENIIIVRRHYYFTLKKRLLKNADRNVTIVY